MQHMTTLAHRNLSERFCTPTAHVGYPRQGACPPPAGNPLKEGNASTTSRKDGRIAARRRAGGTVWRNATLAHLAWHTGLSALEWQADLRKAFEYSPHDLLVLRAAKLQYPMWMLKLTRST